MALSSFQRGVCRLLAQNRLESGQSYLAGGAALNDLLLSPRLSRDLDLFHDTLEALDFTWRADRLVLQNAGYELQILRERAGFVEAQVTKNEESTTVQESVLIQWVRDSAFRFFPLLPHADFGLTLHPFDLATNKILALVGRVETRDWIDALTCHQQVAPLGYLIWAACGKDEGWNPLLILDEAARNSRTSREEWNEIEWQGAAPDLVESKTKWRTALSQAREIVAFLPPEEIGKAVTNQAGALFRGDVAPLQVALDENALRFHEGHIGGAWPQLKIQHP